MRWFAILLMLAGHGLLAAGASLEEKLDMAREARDSHAQIEILRRLVDAAPTNDALREQLVRLWLDVQDYDMAEAAVADWPRAPEGLRARVRAEALFRRDEKPGEAIALLEAARKKNPEDPALTRQLAGFLREEGAAQDLESLLASAPGVSEQADLILLRAGARRTLGEFQAALEDFQLAEGLDPEATKSERPAYERLQAALPMLKASAQKLKNTKDIAELLIRAQTLASFDASNPLIKRDIQQALEISPQSKAALAFQGVYAREDLPALESVRSQMPALSADAIRELVGLDKDVAVAPDSAEALTARAAGLNRLANQSALALADAEAALKIRQTDAAALNEKIFALIRLGRSDEAEAAFRILEKSHPDSQIFAVACWYLADVKLKRGQAAEAVDFATRGIGIAPFAALHETRAAALQRLGRIAEARADLDKVKKIQSR